MTQKIHISANSVIKHYMQKIFFIVIFLSFLNGCGSGSGGDKQTIVDDPAAPEQPNNNSPEVNLPTVPTPATLVVAPDDPEASDENDGYNKPFASLQYALNQLRPGDTLQIKSSSMNYRSDAAVSSQTEFQGFYLSLSGEPNLPITIEGVGSERPIIDQGIVGLDSSAKITGIFLDCVNHVVIRNLEIRNVSGAGITGSLEGCETSNIVIEDNHIHHIYGQDLTAGIRLMASKNLNIQRNQIQTIFRAANSSEINYAQSDIGKLESINIEDNQIWDAENAVTLRAQGNNAIADVLIEGNLIQRTEKGLVVQADDGEAAYVENLSIGSNRLVELESGIHLDLQQSVSQSTEICIHNNVLSSLEHGINAGGISELEVFNNVFASLSGEILNLLPPVDQSVANAVKLFNFNLYWNNSDPSWAVGISQNEFAQVFKLADWQTFSNAVIPSSPDETAYEIDPGLSEASEYFVGNSELSDKGYRGLPLGARPGFSGLACFL